VGICDEELVNHSVLSIEWDAMKHRYKHGYRIRQGHRHTDTVNNLRKSHNSV